MYQTFVVYLKTKLVCIFVCINSFMQYRETSLVLHSCESCVSFDDPILIVYSLKVFEIPFLKVFFYSF